jgi:hypothetical protein
MRNIPYAFQVAVNNRDRMKVLHPFSSLYKLEKIIIKERGEALDYKPVD